jgi:hypothetical protein
MKYLIATTNFLLVTKHLEINFTFRNKLEYSDLLIVDDFLH